VLISSKNRSRARNRMTNRGEMATTGEGNVNSGDGWIPDAVAYRLAVLTRSGGTLSVHWDDSYFEIVLSALKASNIATRALSRLCF
jgi:hypothetical protein